MTSRSSEIVQIIPVGLVRKDRRVGSQLGVDNTIPTRSRLDTAKDAEHRRLPLSRRYTSVHAEYIHVVTNIPSALVIKTAKCDDWHAILFITESSIVQTIRNQLFGLLESVNYSRLKLMLD